MSVFVALQRNDFSHFSATEGNVYVLADFASAFILKAFD